MVSPNSVSSMDLAYLRVITATHLAFVLVFAFFFWQKRTRFAGALTCAWLLQALRVVPLMRQAARHCVDDGVAAGRRPAALGSVCLLVSGGEVSARRIRPRWGALYVGASVPLVIVAHLWGPLLMERLTGVSRTGPASGRSSSATRRCFFRAASWSSGWHGYCSAAGAHCGCRER